jgi:hypothetical protein
MLKITEHTHIYVIAPAGVVTGGVELLHQLVDILRNNCMDACIVYYGSKKHFVPDDYKKYNIVIAENVIDHEENIMVLPEIKLNFLKNFESIQKIVWWLSVDSFFLTCSSTIDIFKFNIKLGILILIKRLWRLVIKNENNFIDTVSLSYMKKQNIVHAYQSIYAQYFLLKHKFDIVISLTDYINNDFMAQRSSVRDDIVVYNPKKGIKFTNKIIKNNSDITFVPIENMNRSEVLSLLQRAKLYIDFGHHPGKDRLPREAVISGCIVITGRIGSARFFEDVPLSSSFKIAQKIINLDKIRVAIKNSIKHYSIQQANMNYYIRQVLNEKVKFENEVMRLFAPYPVDSDRS